MEMINIQGPISPTGYGVHVCNLVTSLIKAKVRVSLTPVSNVDEIMLKRFPGILPALNIQPMNGLPTVKIWHGADTHLSADLSIGSSIVFPVFELDRLTKDEIVQLQRVDGIIVTSSWAKSIIRKHHELNEIPTEIAPEGVSPQEFSYRSITQDTNDVPMLGSIGKFEKRKGHHVLIKTLSEPSIEQKKIQLYCHWHNPFLKNESQSAIAYLNRDNYFIDETCSTTFNDMEWKKYTHSGRPHEIYLSTDNHVSNTKMASFYRTMDIMIFPSFAEGWNLPLCESLSCGAICIAGNNSGQGEYLTPVNHVTINPDSLDYKQADDGVFFNPTYTPGNWQEYKTDAIATAINSALDIENRLKINNELKDFNNKWSWDKAAQKLLVAVNCIQTSLGVT